MDKREKTIKAMDNLILLAKTKEEYTKDSVMNIMCICCSDQMHEAGYSSEEALKIAIELVKTKDKKEVYSELLKLTGYEED
ncbi:MAG: hypothetical protein IKT32_05950 [Clostridia bacterium]|nr:hypothetical protein [Clostridia bacterium]